MVQHFPLHTVFTSSFNRLFDSAGCFKSHQRIALNVDTGSRPAGVSRARRGCAPPEPCSLRRPLAWLSRHGVQERLWGRMVPAIPREEEWPCPFPSPPANPRPRFPPPLPPLSVTALSRQSRWPEYGVLLTARGGGGVSGPGRSAVQAGSRLWFLEAQQRATSTFSLVRRVLACGPRRGRVAQVGVLRGSRRSGPNTSRAVRGES